MQATDVNRKPSQTWVQLDVVNVSEDGVPERTWTVDPRVGFTTTRNTPYILRKRSPVRSDFNAIRLVSRYGIWERGVPG